MANKTPDASESAQSEMLELFFDLGTLLLTEVREIVRDPTRIGQADWLLGRDVGVIAGFNSLSAALARVLGRTPAPTVSNIGGDVPDDAEIQQRIAAELDRIAARTGTVGGDPEDGADTDGATTPDYDVEALAGQMGPGST